MGSTKIPLDLILERIAEDAEKAQQRVSKASEVLQGQLNTDLATQLEFESAYQGLAATTDDFKEGVYSFLEKRDPHFTGK